MATITFRVNGVYDPAALEKLNWILRDWRRNEPTKMDPRLFDVMWEVYHESRSQQPIWIMCGYRSPETNAMLRRRSRSVAEYSQHMLGKAMDVHFADLSMQKIRDIAMRLQSGGVGYYPTSGTPFVHIDVGGVRYWPRMSYEEMARIFPDGKTVDIPSNGRPMPAYDQALADIKARGGETYSASVAPSGGGLLAALFGHGEDDEPASSADARNDAAPARPMLVAAATTEGARKDAALSAMADRPSRGSTLQWSAAPIETDTPAVVQTVAAAPSRPVPVEVDEPAIPLPTPRPADLVVADADMTADTPLPPARPADLMPAALMAPAPAGETTRAMAAAPRLMISARPEEGDGQGSTSAPMHVASADDSMPMIATSAPKKSVPLPSMITEGISQGSSHADAEASVLAFASPASEDPALSTDTTLPIKRPPVAARTAARKSTSPSRPNGPN